MEDPTGDRKSLTRDTMKAAVYLGPQQLEMRELDIPEIGPRELLVQIKAATTCGTDIKTYKRGHPYFPPPIVFGHEFAGVIVQIGDKVNKFKIGQRVVAANSAPCNTCYYCKRGKHNLCENLLDNMLFGAFAEYIRIPSHIVRQNTFHIPDHVTYQAAALTEPLACVVNGNDAANIQRGDRVAIIGTGPIGLMHIQLAKLSGVSQLIAIDLKPQRLELARTLGATDTINPSETDEIKKVHELTDGRGADIVIESAGLPQTWENAIKMTRKGGSTILFSGPAPGTSITIDTKRFHYEELTIKGIFHHTPFYVEKAFNLITSGVIDTIPLITHELPLDRLEEAFQMMMEGSAIKVAIHP